MIRVGSINYVNAFPLFLPISEKLISSRALIKYGNAVQVNNMLKRKEVDIALVSSADFIDNRLEYILLSDLGIASTGKALSVCLFFDGKPSQLNGKTIKIPSHSATSTRLLKVLCNRFWNVQATFQECELSCDELLKQNDPFLLIGDKCLLHSASFPVIDLAEAWNEKTGKSFVFAALATRNDSLKEKTEEVIAFHRTLEDSYLWSKNNMDIVIQKAHEYTSCSKERLKTYFSTLEYELSPNHFHGLDHFSTLEIECPLAPTLF